MEETLLAVDCGTQSLRAILFSKTGDMLCCSKIEYKPYVSPFPGWAEQDPELYWNSLVNACRNLEAKMPQAFAAVAGVGVTTQRASMINVDESGNPLRPALLWLDQRRAKPFRAQTWPLSTGLKFAGLQNKMNDIQTQGKCSWIMQNQPGIWEKTFKYLQVSGFLNHRLTGEFSDSTASQIGHIPFNYKTQEWAGPWQLSRWLFPVEKEKLPFLIKPGELLGRVTEQASLLCGIKKGTPVVACGSDKGCETLGAGVISPKTVSLSFGTTATVQTVSKTYLEVIPYMPPYPSPVSGFYNPEVEIFRGFWMISWFKKEFAGKEVEEAAKLGIPAEEVLNRCLERTSPGAMGLVVQPYWGAGLGLPHAKGAMIGFGDIHTKDHIYRAV
ncbi:MAG: FGGY-family carbohydrate kinase, partial [Desulfobacula sp.]